MKIERHEKHMYVKCTKSNTMYYAIRHVYTLYFCCNAMKQKIYTPEEQADREGKEILIFSLVHWLV